MSRGGGASWGEERARTHFTYPIDEECLNKFDCLQNDGVVS